jgi:HEAT repeat protein
MARDFMANRRSGQSAVPVVAALRGHPSAESEATILRAAASDDGELRRTAAAAACWWQPANPPAVVRMLRTLQTDARSDVRRAAGSALARLGERKALQEIRDELLSEEPAIRSEAADRISAEELTWLWPDLQDLADSEDPQTAFAGVESIERLREAVVGVVEKD